ncbi:hypothetical protein [Rhodococcus rhodochrous]|uniref:hypothetical protein n=1 Tax=Rhodococcus rhodochrous TaxID=1829 RepID=UPI001E594E3E|nr:hypothetical protein [Rhodococcus rhodochrous]MCD2099993.1 hypothetical protein [Rhodococcus rhodochrous]MCD2124391.1 hypothetical protein [Rhodococcus rhodochrous]MDJ0021071.1 hypothetical protein [Rhodococcus rhodochrous]
MFVTDQMRRAALAGVVLANGLAVLTGCGDQPRDAAAVSTSFSGRVVTGTSTDLGSIVLGWGGYALGHRDHHASTGRGHRTLHRPRR